MQKGSQKTIAIFGASGYIGLTLTDNLYKQGHSLKLFIRDKTRIEYMKGSETFDIYDTPLLIENTHTIAKNLYGVDVIYYLIHSMETRNNDFSKKDNEVASIVGKAASIANIKQIIYVGGLGSSNITHALSKHLLSRHITANHLRLSGVSVTEFRTGIVCGAGSSSFEIIRTLSTKLPFIPSIPFNKGLCQIIDIQDLIEYLILALDNKVFYGKIIELGTKRAYTYNELITIHAEVIKQKKIKVISLPFIDKIFNEHVISYMVTLLTKIPYKIARPLIEGMKSLAIIDKYPIENVIKPNPVKETSYTESIINASTYRYESAFEIFWKIPLDLQFYLKKSNRKTFSQYNRHGLRFSTLIEPISTSKKIDYFENAKDLIKKSQFKQPFWYQLFNKLLDNIFQREKLNSSSSTLTLSEGSACKDWRVNAIFESEEQSYITISSQFKGTGFLWFQISMHTMQNKNTFIMIRIFFEPISIKGHMYWNITKKFHKKLLHEVFNNINVT